MPSSADSKVYADRLQLEVEGVEISLLTGVYSEETHLPQPLLISVTADLDPQPRYAPDTPLSASKSYIDLRDAIQALPRDTHFTLVEAVADHIANTLFASDPRVTRVAVKILKLRISEAGERIGIRLVRHRPS